jgi:hypothetical protein
MFRVGKRSIPERHDAIADVFVDRSSVIDDGPRERGQEAVEKGGQALRIVRRAAATLV